MLEGKFLSEEGVINLEDIESGKMNLLEAGCGTGKSTFVFNQLFKKYSEDSKCLYLVDTSSNKEQKSREFKEISQYNLEEKDFINNNFSGLSKITIMTYAKFGALCRANQNFTNVFDIIVADEFHNCLNYINYDRQKIKKRYPELTGALKSDIEDIKNSAFAKVDRILSEVSNCYAAMKYIALIAAGSEFNGFYWSPAEREHRVLAISATPEKIYNSAWFTINSIQTSCAICEYETFQITKYQSISHIINIVKKGEKGIIFAQKIKTLKELKRYCDKQGLKSIALWSEKNLEQPLTIEQRRVRQHIIENESFPEEYDVLLINKAYETGISIKNKIDYIIIHDTNPDTIAQVRGRYRNDLKILYLHDLETKDCVYIKLPEQFLNTIITKEKKKEIATFANIKRPNGTILGWPSIKKLLSNNYVVEDIRVEGKRCVIIKEGEKNE